MKKRHTGLAQRYRPLGAVFLTIHIIEQETTTVKKKDGASGIRTHGSTG